VIVYFISYLGYVIDNNCNDFLLGLAILILLIITVVGFIAGGLISFGILFAVDLIVFGECFDGKPYWEALEIRIKQEEQSEYINSLMNEDKEDTSDKDNDDTNDKIEVYSDNDYNIYELVDGEIYYVDSVTILSKNDNHVKLIYNNKQLIVDIKPIICDNNTTSICINDKLYKINKKGEDINDK